MTHNMDVRNLDTTNTTIAIANKYILQEKLGGGSFGQLYAATNKFNATTVAIKLEPADNPTLVLSREAKVLSELRDEDGFPAFQGYGKEEGFNYLAMGLLGFNLERLLKASGKRLTLKTVLMLADQILARIEMLHSKNILHRDIKPENFCIGPEEDSSTLYLIDFGLARCYRDQSGQHIKYRDGKGLVGTARFASINAHLGVEQSRRDDLEAIGYTLVYFLKGELPWQSFKIDDKQKRYRMIAESKMNTTTEELCRGLPEEFECYLNYVKSLGFEDTPNYKYLRVLFRNLFTKMNYKLDFDYDWSRALNKYYLKKFAGKADAGLEGGIMNFQKSRAEDKMNDKHDCSGQFPQEAKNPFSHQKKAGNPVTNPSGPITTRPTGGSVYDAPQRNRIASFKIASKLGSSSSCESSKICGSDMMTTGNEFCMEDLPSAKIQQTKPIMFKPTGFDDMRKICTSATRIDDNTGKREKLLLAKRFQKTCGAIQYQAENESNYKKEAAKGRDVHVKNLPTDEVETCEWEEDNCLEKMVQSKMFLVNVKNA